MADAGNEVDPKNEPLFAEINLEFPKMQSRKYEVRDTVKFPLYFIVRRRQFRLEWTTANDQVRSNWGDGEQFTFVSSPNFAR